MCEVDGDLILLGFDNCVRVFLLRRHEQILKRVSPLTLGILTALGYAREVVESNENCNEFGADLDTISSFGEQVNLQQIQQQMKTSLRYKIPKDTGIRDY